MTSNDDQEVAAGSTSTGPATFFRGDRFYGHSLLLIQEGQLSVSGERMCTILVRGLSQSSKSVVR